MICASLEFSMFDILVIRKYIRYDIQMMCCKVGKIPAYLNKFYNGAVEWAYLSQLNFSLIVIVQNVTTKIVQIMCINCY